MLIRSLVLFFLYVALSLGIAQERAIICARENPDNDWDSMRSTIWECTILPKRKGGLELDRRLDFGKSHWAPWPFFFDGPIEWMRFQTNTKDDFKVGLAYIDYSAWRSQLLLERSRLKDIGFTNASGYLADRQGNQFRAHLAAGSLTELEVPFTLRQRFESSWLIELSNGVPGQLRLVKADSLECLHEIKLGRGMPDRLYDCELSKDGLWLAICLHGELGRNVDYREAGKIRSELTIFDLNSGRKYFHRFEGLATAGSGFPTIPHYEGRFVEGDTVFEFQSIDDGGAEQVSRLDLSDGSVSYRSVVFDQDVKEPTKNLPDNLPGYLREKYLEVVESKHFEQQVIAHLFVMEFSGLKYEIPNTWSDTKIGWSSDRSRFLMQIMSPGAPDSLFYGDLDTKELRFVSLPEGLQNGAVMGIYFISEERK